MAHKPTRRDAPCLTPGESPTLAGQDANSFSFSAPGRPRLRRMMPVFLQTNLPSRARSTYPCKRAGFRMSHERITQMQAQLQIKFEVTAEQAQALLDVLRQIAGEDHFASEAKLRTFDAAYDECRAAMRGVSEAVAVWI